MGEWADNSILNWLIWFVLGVALSILLGYIVLPLLKKLHVGQTIRAEGPQKHFSKAGTPTMGGLIFIIAMVILFFCNHSGSPAGWLWLFSFLAFGLIGCIDDMLKVVFHRNLGLRGKQKLAGQFVAAILLLLGNELLCGRGTEIYLLAGGQAVAWFDLGWTYYPIIAIFVVGIVNAVNLTDGLDGLAAGASLPAFIGFMLISTVLDGWLGMNMGLCAAAMAGCCMGFIYFNHYPAKVFMGDTGSMALGGAFVGFMLIYRMEIVAIGFGLIYLIEALSVMLQVASFKLRGRRIFLMSPIHHHFEMKGWHETKVTAVFCLASACFVVITLLIAVVA